MYIIISILSIIFLQALSADYIFYFYGSKLNLEYAKKMAELADKGTRMALEESKNYAWNNWAWAINRQDEPDEAGLDERQIVINKNLNVNEYHPAVSGFTFDPKKVETEYTVVKSIIDEYKQSFALGIYGDNTEAEFASFRKKLNAAGIDKVTEELKAQYQNYLQRNINQVQ